MTKLLETYIGSYRYGFGKDKKYIAIFAKPWIDLLDRKDDEYKDEDITYYELGAFCNNLIKGDLSCFEVLFANTNELTYFDHRINFLRNVKNELISKELLSYWLYTAQYLFENAARLGKIKLENKDISDFIFYFPNQYVNHPSFKIFRKCIDTNSLTDNIIEDTLFTENKLAFIKTNFRDIYHLYRSYSKNAFNGLFDEQGNIIEHEEITEKQAMSTTAKGLIIYQREDYLKYKELKATMKDELVLKGYACVPMVNAFRILHLVSSYIMTRVLSFNILAENMRTMCKNILSFEHDVERLKEVFDGRFKETLESINTSTNIPTTINVNIIKRIVKDIRDNISEDTEKKVVT